MAEFFAMGGYAMWVWSAFGLTLLVLVGNVIAAGRRYRRAMSRLRSRLAGAQRGVEA